MTTKYIKPATEPHLVRTFFVARWAATVAHFSASVTAWISVCSSSLSGNLWDSASSTSSRNSLSSGHFEMNDQILFSLIYTVHHIKKLFYFYIIILDWMTKSTKREVTKPQLKLRIFKNQLFTHSSQHLTGGSSQCSSVYPLPLKMNYVATCYMHPRESFHDILINLAYWCWCIEATSENQLFKGTISLCLLQLHYVHQFWLVVLTAY